MWTHGGRVVEVAGLALGLRVVVDRDEDDGGPVDYPWLTELLSESKGNAHPFWKMEDPSVRLSSAGSLGSHGPHGPTQLHSYRPQRPKLPQPSAHSFAWSVSDQALDNASGLKKLAQMWHISLLHVRGSRGPHSTRHASQLLLQS